MYKKFRCIVCMMLICSIFSLIGCSASLNRMTPVDCTNDPKGTESLLGAKGTDKADSLIDSWDYTIISATKDTSIQYPDVQILSFVEYENILIDAMSKKSDYDVDDELSPWDGLDKLDYQSVFFERNTLVLVRVETFGSDDDVRVIDVYESEGDIEIVLDTGTASTKVASTGNIRYWYLFVEIHDFLAKSENVHLSSVSS